MLGRFFPVLKISCTPRVEPQEPQPRYVLADDRSTSVRWYLAAKFEAWNSMVRALAGEKMLLRVDGFSATRFPITEGFVPPEEIPTLQSVADLNASLRAGTALTDTFCELLEQCLLGNAQAVVILTDGYDTRSRRSIHELRDLLESARERCIGIRFIGFGVFQTVRLLRRYICDAGLRPEEVVIFTASGEEDLGRVSQDASRATVGTLSGWSRAPRSVKPQPINPAT